MSKKKTKDVVLPDFYFSFQVLWLRFTGIELLEKKESLPYRIYSVFVLLFTSTYVLVECIELSFHSDFNMIGVVACYIINHGRTMIKVAVVYKNRKEIGDLMKSFHEGYYKPNRIRGGDFEESCISDILDQSNFQMRQYGIFIVIACAGGLLASLQSRFTQSPKQWDLPYVPISLINTTRSPNFELTYLYESSAVLTICFWIFLTDNSVISIIAQTTAQLKILEHSVRNYKVRNLRLQTEGRRNSASNTLYDTISHHLNLLETVDQIEYLCSYLVLCVFLADMILLCLVMYFTTLTPIQSFEFVKYLLYCIAVAVQILLYCWWGNQLIVANEELAQGIFETYDPDDPIAYSKALKLMLVKAQKPLFFTAGKFVALSLDTYKSIIKASFSYFTVLRQLNNQ